MKKSIEVIIKKKDLNKNPIQRIKKVAPGYAFNYLIPNQIADSQNQQIFGSISEQDIINKIFNLTGQNIDKKQIKIDSIKQIGKYLCEIRIDEDINTNITMHVLPNKA